MKRYISLFLTTAIFLSFIVPVGATFSDPKAVVASEAADVLVDAASVAQWNSYFSDVIFGDLSNSAKWAMLDSPVGAAGIGALPSYAALESAMNRFHYKHRDVVTNPIYALIKAVVGGRSVDPGISFDDSLGVYRLIDERSGLWIVASNGKFPYFKPTADDDALGGRWIEFSKVNWTRPNIRTEYDLYDIGYALRDAGQDNDVVPYYREGKPTYQYIRSAWTSEGAGEGEHMVYCDLEGQPYVYRPDPDMWAQDDDNNYYIQDPDGDGVYDDGPTNDQPLIDLDSNMVWFPDGTLNFINNLIYDESTKTYYVDAHSEYDIDNNYFIEFNYHYEYHIDYTSITYIGQTEEYNKKYEVYYELPDGRSSADLTEEDLLALNTQVDVVPYIRSADDTSIRALYHFDGDTRDSSYWNYTGKLLWDKGASITYMDAGPFNGALYLDETEHQYRIGLPSALGSSDFTIQFRLYQSHTLAPQNDSYIAIDDVVLLRFDGSNLLTPTGSVIAPLSIGNWQEICIMRLNGQVWIFHNGVSLGSYSLSSSLGGDVTFHWGSSQQTYKYFDELRILNKNLYSAFGYTPTAVPYDTNLSLVLPDSHVPVADEYWVLNNSGNMLPVQDFSSVVTDSVFWRTDDILYYNDQSFYHPGLANHKPSNTVLAFNSYDGYSSIYNPSYPSVVPASTTGIFLPLGSSVCYPGPSNTMYFGSWYGSVAFDTPYTFSFLSPEGVTDSFTFTVPKYHTSYGRGSAATILYTYQFTSGMTAALIHRPVYNSDYAWGELMLGIFPPHGNLDFVYMEMVQGSSPNTGHEFISSIAPVNSDFQTPTLAVRTDLNITGYQIGGVRPSLPKDGLVWAMVEDGRITSLQIYNGQAWEEVDGRIWTGSRWVPYYAYDVLLLKDLYDIVESDPSLNPIYTQAGFWAWLQKAWGEMMAKLDQIIVALGGSPTVSDCPHVYQSEVDREPGCVEPGYRTFTCDLCGHKYTELIDAHGHDWIVTGSVPDVLDEDGSVIEEGYDELTCSVCDAEGRDYGDGPKENDLFDALGDFIADGITWILDKLEELADSMRQITEIFNGFVEKAKTLAGGFPMFFGAFMALIPEDLATVLWFAVVAFVVLFVWKRWSE